MGLNNLAKFEQKSAPDEKISQDFEPKPDEKAWERKKNEPALWFMRFQIYLKLGKKRSLQAALSAEPRDGKAPKGAKRHQETKKLSDVSVPGSWKRASKLWNWVERSKAYDLHTLQSEAAIMRGAAAIYRYSARSKRLIELSDLAGRLIITLNSCDLKYHVAIIARIQSIFRDIEDLISAMDLHDEADSGALLAHVRQIAASGDKDLIAKLV
jgi:hypothetical protein